MSGSEHARPVWLTPETYRALCDLRQDRIEHFDDRLLIQGLVAGWDAAPADSAEVTKRIMWGYRTHVSDSEVEAVLRALGSPA